jgi:hypothetical protein
MAGELMSDQCGFQCGFQLAQIMYRPKADGVMVAVLTTIPRSATFRDVTAVQMVEG